MDRSRMRRAGTVMTVVLLASATLVGCGSSDDDASPSTTAPTPAASASVDAPGVTSTEIRFAAIATGPSNPLGTCILECYTDGIKAYFAYRNAEGGVHGRKLVLTKELDDELTKGQQRALEVIRDDDTFATFSLPLIATWWPELTKAGVPEYVVTIHTEAAAPNIFGHVGPICIPCTLRSLAYAVKEAKAKKVAVLGYGVSENSKVSAGAMRKTIEMYSGDIGGAEVVYFNDDLAFGLTNGVGPEVTAMKKAGVDFITTAMDVNGNATIEKELHRQGMGDVPMIIPGESYNPSVVADGLFDGDYVGLDTRPVEAETEGTALPLYTQWMRKTGGNDQPNALFGWINATLAYEGIRGAGPDFDREKVIAATDKLTRFTAGGLIPPVDYSRQHEAPTQDDPTTNGPKQDCVVLMKVENAKFRLVGAKDKPWSCWSNANRDWAEPTPTNFR